MVLVPSEQLLFNPGPVNLHPSVKSNLFNVELCHRQPEFERLHESVCDRLFTAAGVSPHTHRLGLLHGSGTLAVDAALSTFVRGEVVVLDNGFYADRILATLAPFAAGRLRRHAPGLGRPPRLDELDAELERHRPDWIAVVHHETTTGLLNPLQAVAELAARHGCRLFVDAVSSLGAHAIDARSDVICFNSNKCLESLPGIAGVFFRADLDAHRTIPVLDVSAYADGMPSTPNVQAFVALDIALDLLAGEDRPARYERLARRVWEAASRDFELLLPEADRSHVLTSVRLGGRDADAVLRRAGERGYVIYAGQQHLRKEIFRVANMGAAIDEPAIDRLFELIAA